MGVGLARIRRCLFALCAAERGPFQGRAGATTLHLPPVRIAFSSVAFGVWPPAAFAAAFRPKPAQSTPGLSRRRWPLQLRFVGDSLQLGDRGLASGPLQDFLAHLGRDPRLQVRVQAAVTADEVALLAQELGYAVSGSDLLRLDGQSNSGVRVTRVDHPGEYPGRYV